LIMVDAIALANDYHWNLRLKESLN
jgi:hypothetical protein